MHARIMASACATVGISSYVFSAWSSASAWASARAGDWPTAEAGTKLGSAPGSDA